MTGNARPRRRTLADYRHLLRAPRPRWSIRTTALAATTIIGVVSTLTLVVLREPLWVELETVTAMLSIVMFMFLGHVLYRGVRFSKHERFDFSLRTVDLGDLWSGADCIPGSTDFADAFDIADGIVGFILGIIISVALILILACVLWLGLNVALNAVALVSIPLFYFFRRSLRHVVARGRTCHGKFLRSCRVAAWVTFLYMAWFYGLIFAAHQLHFALHRY